MPIALKHMRSVSSYSVNSHAHMLQWPSSLPQIDPSLRPVLHTKFWAKMPNVLHVSKMTAVLQGSLPLTTIKSDPSG